MLKWKSKNYRNQNELIEARCLLYLSRHITAKLVGVEYFIEVSRF